MQVSIKWLKDYIDFTETPAQLADKLTMAGIPVENIIDPGEGLEKVVTGRIEKLEPHQNSDHLQICTMNVGLPENIIIVTGAQNVAEGQVVPVAMVGAHLPNGMKISKGKLRGVASNGMLCSAQELKLDLEKLPPEQKTGIYILPPETPVGIPAKDVLGLNDVVLEFELTANRADCFSVVGLVREIAAITGNKPHFPEIKFTEDDATKLSDIFAVEIADPDLCSRFSTRMLKNVKIGPSPEWMQQRLEGAGIRSINNVVDVTNFVMIELGHPMHAYDYDQIAGQKLIARRAVEGEELHTLDDTSRKAKGEMLVIADTEKAAGLAGIMGGFETEITDKTTTVVLESADFYGPCIRRTARACGLSSEASGRFERGIDSETTIKALDRAAQLLEGVVPQNGTIGGEFLFQILLIIENLLPFTPASIVRLADAVNGSTALFGCLLHPTMPLFASFVEDFPHFGVDLFKSAVETFQTNNGHNGIGSPSDNQYSVNRRQPRKRNTGCHFRNKGMNRFDDNYGHRSKNDSARQTNASVNLKFHVSIVPPPGVKKFLHSPRGDVFECAGEERSEKKEGNGI